jgi:hypothetical protein
VVGHSRSRHGHASPIILLNLFLSMLAARSSACHHDESESAGH